MWEYYFKRKEEVTAELIKLKGMKYLISELKPFLSNDNDGINYFFSKEEYHLFLTNNDVIQIFDTHRVQNVSIPLDFGNCIFKGSFTDRQGDYCHIYLKN